VFLVLFRPLHSLIRASSKVASPPALFGSKQGAVDLVLKPNLHRRVRPTNCHSQDEKMNKSEAGPVFKGRHHMRVLKTPTETKNALEYVLLNDSKHRDVIEHLDPFSSAKYFKGWKKLLGHRFANYGNAPVVELTLMLKISSVP
jgi:hypothetical protein